MTTATLNKLTIALDPYAVDENGKMLTLREFAKFVIAQAQDLNPGENILFNYRGVPFHPIKKDPETGKVLFTAHWLTDALRAHLPIEKWYVHFNVVKDEQNRYLYHEYEIRLQQAAEHQVEDLGDPSKLFS